MTTALVAGLFTTNFATYFFQAPNEVQNQALGASNKAQTGLGWLQ